MSSLYRFSYSILYPWSQGQYEEAINRYLRIPGIETEAMREGKVLHETFREQTEATSRLPDVFGGELLESPECELKMECILDDWIQFVGIIDLYHEHRIVDYKTGRSNSLAYVSEPQLKCYQLLASENGYVVKEGFIRHFNQHSGIVTNSKIYLSEYTKEKARDWIITYASEMREAIDKIKEAT